MNHNKYDEEKMKSLLKQMPQIQDNQDRDQLYHKISQQIQNKEMRKQKNKLQWVIPSVASIIGICLLFIILKGSYINFPSEFTQEESSSSNEDAILEEQSNNASSEQAKITEFGDVIIKDDAAEVNLAPVSKVVYHDSLNSSFISIAGLTGDAQYLVPLTVISSSSNEDINSFYNHVNQSIKDLELGVQLFPFEGITFEIDTDLKEVTLQFSDSYQAPYGSTLQSQFNLILSTMFLPFDIETAVFEGLEEGQLDQIGSLEKIDLMPIRNQAYKYYQASETTPKLLVPTGEFTTIEEALSNMKIAEKEFNLTASIPTEVDLEIVSNEESIFVSFVDSNSIGNDQTTLDMLDAILITAKSFGFKEVTFSSSVEIVGPYQLNEAIPVPESANPIYIK